MDASGLGAWPHVSIVQRGERALDLGADVERRLAMADSAAVARLGELTQFLHELRVVMPGLRGVEGVCVRVGGDDEADVAVHESYKLHLHVQRRLSFAHAALAARSEHLPDLELSLGGGVGRAWMRRRSLSHRPASVGADLVVEVAAKQADHPDHAAERDDRYDEVDERVAHASIVTDQSADNGSIRVPTMFEC